MPHVYFSFDENVIKSLHSSFQQLPEWQQCKWLTKCWGWGSPNWSMTADNTLPLAISSKSGGKAVLFRYSGLTVCNLTTMPCPLEIQSWPLGVYSPVFEKHCFKISTLTCTQKHTNMPWSLRISKPTFLNDLYKQSSGISWYIIYFK